ncbi:Isochorismatase family protein [compost metagenome]
MNDAVQTYQRQGFGASMELKAPYGLLIIDFVNGFADPAVFGGGNIPEAIRNTQPLLRAARAQGWPVAHSRIVFADDDSDHNIFTLKVPGMLRASVVDAMSLGFRPLVVSDCVGDRAIGPHDANLFDMAQKYAAVLTRDDALAQVVGEGARAAA